MDAVRTFTAVDIHIPAFVVAAENTRETIPERHHRAVENAVRRRDSVSWNDRVVAVAPDHVQFVGRAFFPGNIFQSCPNNGLRLFHKLLQRNIFNYEWRETSNRINYTFAPLPLG